jgi:hypothetical protein
MSSPLIYWPAAKIAASKAIRRYGKRRADILTRYIGVCLGSQAGIPRCDVHVGF